MSLPELFKVSDAATLARLELLAGSFAESPDDLFAKWEAYSIKNGDSRVADPGALDAFQLTLERQARQSAVKRPRLAPRHLLGGRGTSGSRSLELGAKRFAVTGYTTPEGWAAQASARGAVQLNTDLARFAKERPLNESLRDTSAALDRQIEELITVAQQALRLERADFANPYTITQSPVHVVGRLVREQTAPKSVEEAEAASAAPLDARGVLIEASRRVGGGSRTPLDLSLVDDTFPSMFEGQIVLLRGKNPKGTTFIVDEIVDLPPLPRAKTQKAETAAAESGAGPVRICVVNGLGLDALQTVLLWIMAAHAQQISRDVPSAVVVVGPLVLRGESADAAADAKRAAALLQQFRENAPVPLFVVPHAHDALAADPLFPQAPYALAVEQPVVAVSNPCTLTVGPVALTVASAPTLRDMRLPPATAFRHILRQRRLYPVYPPPLATSVSQPLLEAAELAVAPALLVLPAAKDETQSFRIDDVTCLAAAPRSVTVVTVKDAVYVDKLDVREV